MYKFVVFYLILTTGEYFCMYLFLFFHEFEKKLFTLSMLSGILFRLFKHLLGIEASFLVQVDRLRTLISFWEQIVITFNTETFKENKFGLEPGVQLHALR